MANIFGHTYAIYRLIDNTSTNISENTFNRFKGMRAIPFMNQINKGHSSVKRELVMVLVACHLSKWQNSVCSRYGYDSFNLHIDKEDACLYKVWLKYLQPYQIYERYGPDTMSIHKINKECNSVKIGIRDMVLVFCSYSEIVSSLYQIS